MKVIISGLKELKEFAEKKQPNHCKAERL